MRHILVTGANKGIGLAIAEGILAEHDDTFVLFGSRDEGRGRAALDALGTDRAAMVEIDVSRDASVAAAASAVTERLRGAGAKLHAIVNNAGIGFGSHDMRGVLDVNVRGVHRVCEAFLPMLDPKAGRIVNITSGAAPSFVAKCSPERQRFFVDPGTDWAALDALMEECLGIDGDAAEFGRRGLGDGNAYGLSKACANTYTQHLAKQHPALRINACTPGFIETDLTRPFVEAGKQTAADLGMKSPAEGARCPLFLLFGEPEGKGRFYGSDSKRSPLDRYRAPGTPPYDGN